MPAHPLERRRPRGEAGPGDTIDIPWGTYPEPGQHDLLSNLTLKGAGIGQTTLIVGSLRTDQQSGITVSDLTLESTTHNGGSGILDTGSGNTIARVEVRNFGVGLEVLDGQDAVIDHCDIHHNVFGFAACDFA